MIVKRYQFEVTIFKTLFRIKIMMSCSFHGATKFVSYKKSENKSF